LFQTRLFPFQSSEAIQTLIDDVKRTMDRALVVEEHIDLSMVLNLDKIIAKLYE
jgi:hypothetical protein